MQFGIDFKEALRTPALYILMASCLLWGLCMVVSPYLATIMMTNGVAEMTAANFATLNNLTTAVTAICIGTLTSKLGPKSYVVLAFGSAIIGLVFLLSSWHTSPAIPARRMMRRCLISFPVILPPRPKRAFSSKRHR